MFGKRKLLSSISFRLSLSALFRHYCPTCHLGCPGGQGAVHEPAPNVSMEIEDPDEQPPPPGEERGEENELVDMAMIVGEKNQV